MAFDPKNTAHKAQLHPVIIAVAQLTDLRYEDVLDLSSDQPWARSPDYKRNIRSGQFSHVRAKAIYDWLQDHHFVTAHKHAPGILVLLELVGNIAKTRHTLSKLAAPSSRSCPAPKGCRAGQTMGIQTYKKSNTPSFAVNQATVSTAWLISSSADCSSSTLTETAPPVPRSYLSPAGSGPTRVCISAKKAS